MSEPANDNTSTSPESEVSSAPPFPGAMPKPAADAPEPEGKPKFFDRPLAKDPIFWTGLAGMVLLGSLSAFRNPSGSPLNPFGLIASSLDAALAAAYGWFLAGFLPALIRRLIRRSQRKSALTRLPSTNEPSWQQDPVKPGRYRWWDGTAWSDVVAPPPARGPNKVAWLLVPAFLIVVLAGWAGGLSSSSGSPGAKGTQVAAAYKASSDAIGEYMALDVSDEDFSTAVAANEVAVQKAVGAHAQFSATLRGITTQDEVGPIPSLELLRMYDAAAGEYLNAEATVFQKLSACSPSNQDCLRIALDWYEANAGDAADRMVNAMQAIEDEATSYGGTQ